MNQSFPYQLLNKTELITSINQLATQNIPFLLIIDYKAESGYVIPESAINHDFVRYAIGDELVTEKKENHQRPAWKPVPVSEDSYLRKFNFVVDNIRRGNSFLVNLTQPTLVHTNLNLNQLFELGKAKYKLWLKNRFVVLSPESFIKIRDGKIYSYPMKGTIDASIPDAANLIMNDKKEQAEHATIVDLIRNDLSMVAHQVEVVRYRYIDKLHTNVGDLLQVSSEICGKLPGNFLPQLGEIIFKLLPAGSVTGAPKSKTLEIIEAAEGYSRGFYTGIFGWFDGQNLDTAVMIRFIEQQGNQLVFKSGGGITSLSNAQKEYNELIRKVYVPLY